MKRNTLLLWALAAGMLLGHTAHARLYIDTPEPENRTTAVAPTTETIETPETSEMPEAPETTETSERTETSLDTLRRIDPSDSEIVQLHEADKDGNMLLDVNGFRLKLGRSYESKELDERVKSRVTGTVFSDIECGFTMLTGVAYDRPGEAHSDFLDQKIAYSDHFGIEPLGISVRAGQKNRSFFSLGIQYSIDNIRLTNSSYTLRNDGRLLVPLELDEPVKMSKLRYSTLGFALRYQWRPVDKLFIQLSTHYDFLMSACAITKKPKEKTGLSGFAPFRFGIGATVGYEYFGFFVRYTPTSLFKSSSGLRAQTLSFGLTINL